MQVQSPSRELERRMAQPQRHRLLQGYPMAKLMEPYQEPLPPLSRFPRDDARPLLVGVLPHASCNPSVRGCGFCTFPHEPFEKSRVLRVMEAVRREIVSVTERVPLGQRKVHGVYLGGGTANLSPPEALRGLLGQLSSSFDLSAAELTLEGVPRYFLVREAAALALLQEAPVRHARISMGVQSFNPDWLSRMGRAAFGDQALVQEVVFAAHQRGMTTSLDLLYNLPGQSLSHALSDVRKAIEMESDQICIYNLVLTKDLGTEWSKDDALLGSMWAPSQGCAHWLALREELLAHGYVQTTLTNFERRSIPEAERFVYERCSFDPATFDAIGFGPAAISTFTARGHRSALKWINAENSGRYADAIEASAMATERAFRYSLSDLHLLHLTRNLSALSVDRARYAAWLGRDPVAYLGPVAELLASAGLIEITPAQMSLSPTGMFYADAVTGLMAHTRVADLRGEQDDKYARESGMG